MPSSREDAWATLNEFTKNPPGCSALVVECSSRWWALWAIDGLPRPAYAQVRRFGLYGTPSPPLARHGGSGADHRDSAGHRLGDLAGADPGVLPGFQHLQQVLGPPADPTPLLIIERGGVAQW